MKELKINRGKMLSFKEYILENGGGGAKSTSMPGLKMPNKGIKKQVIDTVKKKKILHLDKTSKGPQ